LCNPAQPVLADGHQRQKLTWLEPGHPAKIIPAPISAFARLRRDKAGVAAFGRKPHFNRRRSAEPPLRQCAPIRNSITVPLRVLALK
jgi:hypothetical protein